MNPEAPRPAHQAPDTTRVMPAHMHLESEPNPLLLEAARAFTNYRLGKVAVRAGHREADAEFYRGTARDAHADEIKNMIGTEATPEAIDELWNEVNKLRKAGKTIVSQPELDEPRPWHNIVANERTGEIYNPIAGFGKSHRTPRGVLGDKPKVSPQMNSNNQTTPAQPEYKARNFLQERHELRQSKRMHKVLVKNMSLKERADLYGNMLGDKDAVKDELEHGRYRRYQKKSIRQQSRIVRGLAGEQRSLNRNLAGLKRSAAGEDIPSKLSQRGARRDERLLNRWERRQDKLDNIALRWQESIQRRERARAEAKARRGRNSGSRRRHAS